MAENGGNKYCGDQILADGAAGSTRVIGNHSHSRDFWSNVVSSCPEGDKGRGEGTLGLR